MSHIRTTRISHMNESCATYEWYEWVMSHLWMDESRLTYEWVVSHVWMSHISHMNGVSTAWRLIHAHMMKLRHVWMSHVSRTNEWSTHLRKNSFMPIWWSRAAYEWVISHVWMNSLLYLLQLQHMRNMKELSTAWTLIHARMKIYVYAHILRKIYIYAHMLCLCLDVSLMYIYIPAAVRALRSDILMPSIHSIVSTLFVDVAECTAGT